MKLRLLGSFEGYTGQMGIINFVDGLSLEDVLPVHATRIAGVIGAEWEDGSPANVSQIYLDSMGVEAPTPEEQTKAEVEVIEKKAEAGELAAAVFYTEEQLSAIADEKGIAGLREIAEPMGIKSNSIATLISAIIKKNPPKQAEEVVEEDSAQVE